MNLSEHFTFEELTRTDNHQYLDENIREAQNNMIALKFLATFAESVRNTIGCPMIITSGYRCEALNNAIGGSKNSQHIKFEAVDFIPKDISAFEAFTKIIISPILYGQVILEKRGNGHIIHISMGNKKEKLYSPRIGKYIKL